MSRPRKPGDRDTRPRRRTPTSRTRPATSPPCIFLSHSGADTEAARKLKDRLLAAPDAHAAGLKVWFDKDDLRPGGQYAPQIEVVIEREATAFVVYVGSKGVVNWVDAEVRVALARAIKDPSFLFIPILAAGSVGSAALPAFARLYQSVRDPLGDGEELGKLLKAVLKSDWDKAAKIIDEPFVGLRSMREEEADRFFGRDAEIEELAEKFRRHRLVAIVADSGTGKSSLAEAGFASAFRGGALADPSRSEPDDRVWHIVSMRPGTNPEKGLRTGVSEAAEKIGLSGSERAGLRKRVALDDPSETAFALQCDLPTKKTATLLIVNQFEELLTQTPDALAAPFVRLLLALADSDKDIRVLLTVRADYFNLISAVGIEVRQTAPPEQGLTEPPSSRTERSDPGEREAPDAPLDRHAASRLAMTTEGQTSSRAERSDPAEREAPDAPLDRHAASRLTMTAEGPVGGADGKTLFERLTNNGRAAILPLKRISEAGLSEAVRRPLGLAGHRDEAAQDALTKAVKRDISDQPSDLPLMQVALRAAWREHRAVGIGLLEAYELVGGVLGALANEAEAAHYRLEADDQARLEFVSSGSCGSATPAARRGEPPLSRNSTRRGAILFNGSQKMTTDGSSWSAARAPRLRTRRSSPSGRGSRAG